MVDVATGWTECLPLVTRDGSLVVEAMKHVQTRSCSSAVVQDIARREQIENIIARGDFQAVEITLDPRIQKIRKQDGSARDYARKRVVA
jgi:hypothetical protein